MIVLGWVIVTAILRHGGATGTAIGIAQLIPTAALVLALALTLELACAEPCPAAGDNASGVAVALALVRVLDVAPPPRLAVEVVLQGAGEDGMIGLRRHMRSRRAVSTRRWSWSMRSAPNSARASAPVPPAAAAAAP